ncbi:MAG: DNA helicase RecQ [Acidobacteria bacterium]|nr:DNA helicase RecQ [Acidobacteriota bacterium]|tara:strand:- start:1046 stop:2911 length:1866 start_codon:yes stop_codon:yes gene_type:complete
MVPSATDDQLEATLARFWGYRAFRPLQREAIEANLENRDSVVVLPTGGGKSLCFQMPALVRSVAGPGLVVSPLVSLMKDQVDGLLASGIPAAALNSSLTPDERRQTHDALDAGACRLLYVTPERLVGEGGESFRARLHRWGVQFVAVDEAHCISQWGHEFRPEYRQLARLREEFPELGVHAFTATATQQVRDDIASQLALREPEMLVGSFDRPNLVYRVLVRTGVKDQIQRVLDRHLGEAGIIYCVSRKEVEQLATWLKSSGHRALPYHAGLSDDTRRRHQEAFLEERADTMVATVAFGMGIDRSNIRYVIHAGSPRSLEHYQQESGRAGRDGLEAECVLFYSGADYARWRQMLEQSGELSDQARRLLRDIERYAGGTRCRHAVLVEYFGQAYTQDSCNACDWCLKELEPVTDSLTLAQKILSTVVRLGQNFGMGHVIDVLRGRTTEQVSRGSHQELSTFGLLADTPIAELRGYLDQLTQQELLQRTDGPYPVLQLTDTGVTVLKGQGLVELYRQPRPAPGQRRRRDRADPAAWEGVDRGLFEALRECRMEIARARGVPPYVVFHDNTLRDLARRRPTSPQELLQVYGIGARKADDFGPIVLRVIQEYEGHTDTDAAEPPQ